VADRCLRQQPGRGDGWLAGVLLKIVYLLVRQLLGLGVLVFGKDLAMPEGWHREQDWMSLFEAACGPPAHAA
jgi:hypothetical protein